MSRSRGDRDFVAWAERHAVPDECQFCGNSTDWHPSVTCLEHRDLASPIIGLDAPYEDALESPADAVGDLPSGGVARRQRPDPAFGPARPLDRGSA